MTNPKTETTKAKQADKDLQAAYEIHALAQAMYGQLVMTHPWVAHMTPNVFAEPTGWPPIRVGDLPSAWSNASPWTC